MDYSHEIAGWLIHYGGFALFALLALGIIGLPVPDETILLLAGFLISKGKISLFPTTLAALLGTISGITFSYYLGCITGKYLKKKLIAQDKIARVRGWYEHLGKWTLFIGYFFPLIRHLTGYLAGTTHLKYRTFALFAYTGAIIWSLTFLAIGYYLGNEFTILQEATH